MCEGPISYLYLVIIGTTLVLPRKYIAFWVQETGPASDTSQYRNRRGEDSKKYKQQKIQQLTKGKVRIWPHNISH